MTSIDHSRTRPLRRIAAAAGIAFGAGIPAIALAEVGSDRPGTTPDPTDPAPETQASEAAESDAPATGAEEFQTMAVDAEAIAEAVTGLSTFFGEHAAEVGDSALFLQPDAGCPALPVDNLVWFADGLGIEADPLSAFASIDTAERAAPDLVAGASVAEPAASVAEPGASVAGTVAAGKVLVTTCGFGVASGGATSDESTPTTVPVTTAAAADSGPTGTATATESAGLPSAEGMLLRAAVFDDSTFADDVVAQHPDAQVVSPTAEGLDGEIVGDCTPATSSGSSDCTVWWHDDGLGVGIELSGPTATFETASDTVEAMVPSVVTTLGALATGETPDIPPPPTAPPDTEPAAEEIAIPSGESSATVEGSVERGDFVSYWFWAGSGQDIEMNITAPDGNATFNLYAPDGTQLAANQTSFAGPAPAVGNYAIEVGATDGTADYAVTLTITGETTEPSEPPSTPPSSEVPGGGIIEFPPGEGSATVEGELGEGIVDTWTLSANAGQTMEVLLYTDERNAAFSLYGPDGDRLADNVPSWTVELPGDGVYVIEVTSIGGQAAYELGVVIT